MNKLPIKHIIILLLLLSSSILLEAQKQGNVNSVINKDSFNNLNKIPFEITRYRVGSPLKIKEIKGWSPENLDYGKKSIYFGFIACADDGTIAKIIGSGFGKQQGNGFINCSEQKIKITINAWNDTEININVQTVDKYLETRKVTLTITNDSFEQLSISVDVIGILKVKNANNTESYYSYGQSMWSVAKNRQQNELPIPESPTTRTAEIDENYEPKLWDCIIFDNNTMGIIIKCSSKNTEEVDGHEQYTWSVILEEMNTKCSEKKSVVICKFQLGNTINDGESYKFGILLNIGSSAGGNVKAVAYYR
ncbi:MAG: hypothetical protein V1779_13370 [bacterium]